MSAWLLAHEAQIQSYLWLTSFILVALAESFWPRRTLCAGTGVRWFNNVALTAIGLGVLRLCVPITALSFAVLVEERGWGFFNSVQLPVWLSCALTLIVLDLGNYAVHRLFHTAPLWRYHKIHHCDLDFDCGTAIRHHPVETVLGLGAELLIIAAIGAPPVGVLIALTLAAVASVFNHGNVALPSLTDRFLRRLIVTPDMHRIHHSALVPEGNSNFANLFPWWDHLFSTYCDVPQLGHESMAIGIEEARTQADVTLWKLLAMPFYPRGTPSGSTSASAQPQSR